MSKKTNKRGILLILLVAFLLICGGTMAYMFKQTPQVTNQFDKATVNCNVVETFDGTEKSSIIVKNTGNVDAYIRVKITSHWEDADGNIVAKASTIPNITVASNWIVGKDNTYYYASALKADESTSEMLGTAITLAKEDGYYQVVEVFAEAIQADPVKAAAESWNVEIDYATNKIIKAN